MEFTVEGMEGRYTVSEFGYPPMNEIRRDGQNDGWEAQPGLFGERRWVTMRHVDGGWTISIGTPERIRPVT